MPSKLQQYFPMIRTKQEILHDIRNNYHLNMIFESWPLKGRQWFLDICTGMRGVKILYDSFFKEIMNPENSPERLNGLLSVLLNQEVKIIDVLPVDSTRLADETSLVIMDIVVELQDGTIADIECQKIGYKFPGERSACYSSDLLLRQYKRIKGTQTDFSYRLIRPVYTIVFFETSPVEFHEFPDTYVHTFKQTSDSGLKIELLQKYIFIPLDIFKKKQHNKIASTQLDAWLTFLSMDDPESIINLIRLYPEFRPMYQDVYDICLNMERVMGMFSKELQELDRNTVKLMIDEMQEDLEKKKKQVLYMDKMLEDRDKMLEDRDKMLEDRDKMLEDRDKMLEDRDKMLEDRDKMLEDQKKQMKDKDAEILKLKQLLNEYKTES